MFRFKYHFTPLNLTLASFMQNSLGFNEKASLLDPEEASAERVCPSNWFYDRLPINSDNVTSAPSVGQSAITEKDERKVENEIKIYCFEMRLQNLAARWSKASYLFTN